MPKQPKVRKLGNTALGQEETQRREAIIKESLSRTKNTSPNQLKADEIRGGSPAQLADVERQKEIKRIELEQALLNATPANPTQQTQAQAPQTPNQQVTTGQNNNALASDNKGEEVLKSSGVAESGRRILALASGATAGLPLPGTPESIKQSGQTQRTEILQSTAQLADIFRTAVSGKSSKQLTASEEVMNTYLSALSQDITLYQQGLKSFDEVRQNIQQAEASINQYESNLVGEGRRNLNFWLDKGARIESNVIVQRDRLQDFKRLLVNSATQQPI